MQTLNHILVHIYISLPCQSFRSDLIDIKFFPHGSDRAALLVCPVNHNVNIININQSMYVFGHRLPPRVKLRNEHLSNDTSAGCQTSGGDFHQQNHAKKKMVMIQAADTPELLSTVHLSWNKGITDHLAITLFLKNICSCGHAVMSQRLLH